MATYVTSPPTQSGVADTKTSITKSFTFFGSGGYVQVDYEVNSEAFSDLFKIIINGFTGWTDSDVGNGPQTAQISTSAGSQTLRLQYEKDGGVDSGSDNVVVTEIRIYNGSAVLQQTHNFSGTNGTGPPTGWTEILNDGGVAVTGSHWTLVDDGLGGGVSGTIASTTTLPTFAGAGKQTHVGTVAATTTKPTFAAAGTQTHLGVLGATATLPTFAGSGATGSSGITATLAATTTAPVFAGAGAQTHVGALAATTTAPTFAALGIQSHVGAIAATASLPTFYAEGTQAETLPPSAHGVFLHATGATTATLDGDRFRARVEVDRGSSAVIRPTPSYNAEFSEG